MKGLTFADRVKVYVYAGDGGSGASSFRREKYIDKGGPDGGDGGDGGSVYFRASKDQSSLLDLYYNPHRRAQHGERGSGKQCTGRSGDDVHIDVPCGTIIKDFETEEIIGEVVNDGDILLAAKGGRGGLGNMHFATPSYQAPRECTPGTEGERKVLLLELKIVADAGLVGYPNAGKSTLLSAVSPAKPKIAAYPFTTLNPVIGTIIYDDYLRIRVADIPGLIEGAHEGVGLGHDFLRHIERTKILVFVVDMAAIDGRHPADDYKSLREELRLYREDLLDRPYLLVANKMDLPEARRLLPEFIQQTGETPLEIAAQTREGIEEFKALLRDKFKEVSESPLT